MSHDQVAETYYDPRRITVRNFEAATEAALRELRLNLPDRGWIADIGSGRGSIGRALGLRSRRSVHIDISPAMLRLSDREPSVAKLEADGAALPLRDGSVSLALAFLFDAFNVPLFYCEARRVLMPDGMLIATLPHHSWGTAFRASAGDPPDKARFPLENGGFAEVDSFLRPAWEIIRLAEEAGFSKLRLEDCRLPRTVAHVSQHIELAAEREGVSVYDLPVVQLMVAWP